MTRIAGGDRGGGLGQCGRHFRCQFSLTDIRDPSAGSVVRVRQLSYTVLHSKRVDFFLCLHADLFSTAGN